MTALIKVNPKLPAAIARLVALATPETMSEMTGGVTSGYPIISYKGKVWRIRQSGEETMHLDDDGNAMPTIDIVLVQANPAPSKIFYDTVYEEGSTDAPRCFSNDGIKPDVSIQEPINPVCASCPNNVWGSKITPNGKKTRACADARRMAVVFANELQAKGAEASKYLLRVPPASLNPLKDYAEKVLAPKGIPFFGIVSRIGFDPQAAHPQFTFKPARFVDDNEAEAIASMRGSEDVRRILAEAQEFPAQAPAEAGEEAAPAATKGVATPAPTTATPPAAGKPAPAKMRPASEEEAGLASTAAPKAAAPAAAKKAAKPKPAPAPAPVAAAPADDDDDDAAAPNNGAKPPAGFDDLLDTILNG
jgi:hypothetical protein